MTCQAVPLQAQSMLSNHLDHNPPSRPDATPVLSHRPPPPTRTHHQPPPRSWSTARAQCQRDTGSATSTTISPHDSEYATLDPTPRPPVRDPQTAIHSAATEALDLQQGSSSSAGSLPVQAPSVSSHNPFSGIISNQAGSGGMKLEAVMENLQRQQAARLAVEEKLREKDIESMAESQIHQQALAFRHYQAAMLGALAGGATNTSNGVTLPIQEVRIFDGDSSKADSVKEGNEEADDTEELEIMDGDEQDDGDGLDHYQHGQSLVHGTGLAPTHLMARDQTAFTQARRAESPSAQPQSQQPEWTYEEQFKQGPVFTLLLNNFPDLKNSMKVNAGETLSKPGALKRRAAPRKAKRLPSTPLLNLCAVHTGR
ncbi:unnamed protein product [Pleuronectes platessa]|uniref:Uncharacterized protein n=1 Tax=Pleuronectes platessa TaxID=8262 RepID=A0A9N7U0Z8_PLEPL|nr:unnamed protein product [Pleuronectes platessa]